MAFFELSFGAEDFQSRGFDSRDEIEDPLEAALQEAGGGEVTGGGAGRGRLNIDIETFGGITDEQAVELIRRVLTKLDAPRSSILSRSIPQKQQWQIFEGE